MARRFWAFTLAETLIVMGIIGVVAALTVPNLNASTGEKEKVAKVKKIYKDLNDAYGRAVAVYGPVDEWFAKDTTESAQSTRFGERLLDFLKVSKNCKTEVSKGCFYSGDYLYLNATSMGSFEVDSGIYKIVTADGSSVSFYISSPKFSENYAVSCPGPYCEVAGIIDVDIDGPSKGAHTFGKDMFSFQIDKEYGVLPMGGMAHNTTATDTNLTKNCFKTGESCAGWLIETGNMDYLKATNGTCANGTILSWTNTTCK